MSDKPQSNRVLGSFALTMITLCAVLSLREAPMMAKVGAEAIFFYATAALLFLLPSAFVCAELATMLPDNGGVYTWVQRAFGNDIGFIAIWMEWINNVISFPASLAAIVVTVAYAGFPALHSNKWLLFASMMVIYWGCTLFNFLGIKVSSKLSILGALFGIIIPGILIVILAVIWVVSGHPIQFSWQPTQHIIPNWSVANLVFFIGVLSSYSGMQVTAFHAQNIRSPGRSFPRAISMASILIFAISLLLALSIAAVVPPQKIDIIGGMAEGFRDFFTVFHLTWLTPVLSLSIAFGMLASLSAWLMAPARGLHHAALQHQLPRVLAKTNARNMPVNIFWLQAILGTALASVFLFMPTLKSAFWTLITLTSQFTVLMYILVFASVIRLRYSEPNKPRPYRIPGKNYIVWIISGVGILACATGFILGLFPPKQINIGHHAWYVLGIIIGDLIIIITPILILKKCHSAKSALSSKAERQSKQ